MMPILEGLAGLLGEAGFKFVVGYRNANIYLKNRLGQEIVRVVGGDLVVADSFDLSSKLYVDLARPDCFDEVCSRVREIVAERC